MEKQNLISVNKVRLFRGRKIIQFWLNRVRSTQSTNIKPALQKSDGLQSWKNDWDKDWDNNWNNSHDPWSETWDKGWERTDDPWDNNWDDTWDKSN